MQQVNAAAIKALKIVSVPIEVGLALNGKNVDIFMGLSLMVGHLFQHFSLLQRTVQQLNSFRKEFSKGVLENFIKWTCCNSSGLSFDLNIMLKHHLEQSLV